MEKKGVKEIGVNKLTNKIIVKVNPKFYRPSEVDYLKGDPSLARKNLNGSQNNFDELVEMMIRSDLDTENK